MLRIPSNIKDFQHKTGLIQLEFGHCKAQTSSRFLDVVEYQLGRGGFFGRWFCGLVVGMAIFGVERVSDYGLCVIIYHSSVAKNPFGNRTCLGGLNRCF